MASHQIYIPPPEAGHLSLSLHHIPRHRALLHRRIVLHCRMRMHLLLMMLQRRIRHRTHLPTVRLDQLRVRGRQVSAHGPDDRARGIGDGTLGVGVLEGWAGSGVYGLVRVIGDSGAGRVVVDDVVVGDFGVGNGAACFGVGGVVFDGQGRSVCDVYQVICGTIHTAWVVGWEDVGGCTDYWADLSGGHDDECDVKY